MTLKSISPHAAHELIGRGAALIDIRDIDEYDREHIPQARHVSMEHLSRIPLPPDGAAAVIFHCRSGSRTRSNAQALSGAAACDAYVLEGGLDAWKKAGLPIVHDATRPLALQRQVQIAAGSLVVLGAVLGATASPWWHGLSGFVGAGLVFAGLTGYCGLARLLMAMPWNRGKAP